MSVGFGEGIDAVGFTGGIAAGWYLQKSKYWWAGSVLPVLLGTVLDTVAAARPVADGLFMFVFGYVTGLGARFIRSQNTGRKS